MTTFTQEKIDEYYQALLNRDSQYVGIFYVGVKTTSVFCIATCRARKPLKKNVTFYASQSEALEQGFRPCKICKPTENPGDIPHFVQEAMQLVLDNPSLKIGDPILRAHKLSPDKIRRWFKKQYGITFHDYQRMHRMNTAFRELQQGKKATTTAFDLGYESLSGFGHTYKKLMGSSPTKLKNQGVILINQLSSPLGPLYVCATEKGICLLEFTDRDILEKEFRNLERLCKAKISLGENQHIHQVRVELAEYFAGKRKTFDVPLDLPGTNFQQKVWNSLLDIPFGTTTTYHQQAAHIHQPKAIRALASANASNRIAIMIPCHRLIGKDGAIRGYGGGIERKRWLIGFEAGLG